jgi:hypothetical protein
MGQKTKEKSLSSFISCLGCNITKIKPTLALLHMGLYFSNAHG